MEGTSAGIDWASEEHARAWLKGQPLGTVGKLARKYGKTEDLKLLSIMRIPTCAA